MLEVKFRVFHKEKQRMYNHVKGFIGDTWYILEDTAEAKPRWKLLKFKRDELIVMPFIGRWDDTKWKDLAPWERRLWVDKGYNKRNWKGKEIYHKDILLVVNSRQPIETAKVVKTEHLFCLKDRFGCIKELSLDHKDTRIFVKGNSKEDNHLDHA